MKEFEKIDYLPLGSIVTLKKGMQKIIIIARGIVIKSLNPPVFFDYGGSLYPQGLIGDQILYFNHKDIDEVIHQGYTDDDDKKMVNIINDGCKDSGYERKDISELAKRSAK